MPHPQTLEDKPKGNLENWQGYFNNTDPTVLPPNALTFPSKNCFIPNKDKIVPRLGKTLLGQPYSREEVAIGFDNFSLAGEILGQVFDSSSLPFPSDTLSHNSAVRIDDTHYLLFWAGEAGHDGYAQVFEVNLDTGGITRLGSPLVFDSVIGRYSSCAKISATHYINFWQGAGSDGFAQVFAVDPVTFAVTAIGTPLEFDTADSSYNSCAPLGDGQHFINFWTGPSGDGFVQVFNVDPGTFAVTALSVALEFDTADATFNSCAPLGDGSHFINFWTGVAGDGFAQVFAVNLGTFAVTALSTPLEFDTSDATYNSCASLGDGQHFVNFWRSTSSGLARTFSVNLGTFAVTAVGSGAITFEATAVTFNSCASAGDGSHFLNVWKSGTGNKHYVQAFEVNLSTFDILAMYSPEEFFTLVGSPYNSLVSAEDGEHFINFGGGFVSGVGQDYATMFQVTFEVDTIELEHGCAGDNRILWVAILVYNSTGGDVVTGVTYDGDAMTLGAKVALDANRERYLYYLVDPNPGFNLIEVTTSGVNRSLEVAASSYYGADQVAPTIISSVGPSAGVSNISISETPVEDDSWVIGFFSGGGAYDGGLTEGPDTVFRGGTDNFKMADNGEAINPPASTTLEAIFASPTDGVAIAAAFAPKGGTPESKSWQIVGHKKRFTNDGGYTMEVRIVRTEDVGMGDQVEILLENPTTGEKQWYPITERANPLEAGTAERYYMDEFFDTNLNPALSRKNSRLVWVNGTKTIFSWAGGVNPITEVVDGVSVKGEEGKSWISQGFPYIRLPAGEIQYIVVKGRKYEVQGGWDTDTLLLSNTDGIEVGDYATAYIAPAGADVWFQDTNVLPDSYPNIDFCRQNKNYMFYGSFSSRQLFMSNNFGRAATEVISFKSTEFLGDLVLPVIPDFTGTGTVIFRITIDGGDPATPNTFTWSVTNAEGVTLNGSPNIPIPLTPFALRSPYGCISFNFPATPGSTGYVTGDYWEITATQSIGYTDTPLVNPEPNSVLPNPEAWANFFYTLPRVPGQGYVFFLPANFWTMDPQEDGMYINDQYGQWSVVDTEIAADLQSETISFNPLKQLSSAKAIFPYMISHMENEIVFVTEDKNLNFIGRKQFLELPQMDYLSQPVAKDFIACSFEKGSIEYLNKKLYITSPKESTMLVYDNQAGNKYWQPPQEYAENGILSIVDNDLISHSNLRNQTFTLFDGQTDDGSAFTVIMRTPYLSFGERWRMKNSNKSFLEGYIAGLPPLVFTAIQGINGCAGIFPHNVEPVLCLGADRAPLGEGSLGSHPNGSDQPGEDLNHFNEIFTKYNPILQYFFLAFQLECSTKNHTYEVLSMGVNAIESNTGNNSLIPEEQISKI